MKQMKSGSFFVANLRLVHSEVIAMKSVAQTAESLGTIRGYWHNVSGQADPK